jgi:transmembrane sensor
MTQTKTASEIDAEAAQWVARIDRGPLSSSAADAFRLWIEDDSRSLGAFGRIRAISLASEKARALGSDFDGMVGRSPVARFSRRQMLMRGGAIAASVVVATATGVGLILPRHRYVTGRGEVRVVALSDGSVITLNTGSEIAVEFTDVTRAIRLVRGEALFDVAKNIKCPFVVGAGDTRVQVVGTSFTVRNMEALPVEVLVREGVVEVSDPVGAKGHVVRITANTRAIALQGHSAISAVPVVPAELHRELAWKDGLLAFEGQSLGSAAAEFARYSDTRIVIADSALAQEEIAGLFKATDPVGFAQTVAATFKAHVTIRENEVRIDR